MRKTEIQQALLYSRWHIDDHLQEYGHLFSYPDNLVVLQVVEEHRASNVNVEEQEEHLPETVKDWIDQILLMEPPATPGTWVPLVSM